MSERALILSDAHLGAGPDSARRHLLDFLARVPDEADELVVNGDLFDFWFEWRTAVPSEHFDVLRALARIVDAGVRVRHVAGNHDAWGGAFLRDRVGLELVEGPLVTEIGGRRSYLAHGDGLAGGDWGYRALKTVIRSRPAVALFRALHPDFAHALIDRVSRTEREIEAGKHGATERAEVLSEHADRLLREDLSLDLVIFGHSHRPELREVEPGRHYLNAGDWIRSLSYGVVTPDAVTLERWES